MDWRDDYLDLLVIFTNQHKEFDKSNYEPFAQQKRKQLNKDVSKLRDDIAVKHVQLVETIKRNSEFEKRLKIFLSKAIEHNHIENIKKINTHLTNLLANTIQLIEQEKNFANLISHTDKLLLAINADILQNQSQNIKNTEPNSTLKEHQLRFIKHVLTHRGTIAVGSEKTLIAVTAVKAVLQAMQQKNKQIKLTFISPKSLTPNFKDQMIKTYQSYDFTNYHFDTYGSFYRAYKRGEIDCTNTFLIIDEAHNFRSTLDNTGKQRKYAQKIIGCVKKAFKVLLLTRTLIIKSPYDIANLIAMVDGNDPVSEEEFDMILNPKNTDLFNDYFSCKLSFYTYDQDEHSQMSQNYQRIQAKTDSVDEILDDLSEIKAERNEKFLNRLRPLSIENDNYACTSDVVQLPYSKHELEEEEEEVNNEFNEEIDNLFRERGSEEEVNVKKRAREKKEAEKEEEEEEEEEEDEEEFEDKQMGDEDVEDGDVKKKDNKFGWTDIDKFKMSAVYRNELSFNGFKIDVLKSGLQKYIRRNIIDKAMWCAVELDIFAYCPFYMDEDTKNEDTISELVSRSESIRTNLLNRLRIIYLEDIGVANIQLLRNLDKWFSTLFACQDIRKTTDMSKQSPDKIKNWLATRQKEMCLILKIVKFLCESKKSRSLSHVKAVFMNASVVNQKKIMMQYPQLFVDVNNTKYSCPFKYQLFSGEQQYEKIVMNFVEMLYAQNDLAFYWTKQILDTFKSSQKRLGSLKPELLVFDILLWFIKKRFTGKLAISLTESVKILISWFKNPRLKFKEIILTLHYAIMLVVKHNIIDLKTNDMDVNVGEYDITKCIDLYNLNLSGSKIEFDDYVVDIHTKKGRQNKKTKTDFATEGAFVENEDDIVVCQLYKNIYNDTKKWETSGDVSINSVQINSTAKIQNTPLITKISSTAKIQNTPLITKIPLKEPVLPELNYYEQTLSQDTLKRILTWPTAQKQTASWKGITYMGPAFVAKGPYDIRKQGDKGRLMRINRRQLCNIGTHTPNLTYVFAKEKNSPYNVWVLSKQLAATNSKSWKSNDRNSCGVYRVSDLKIDTWKTNESLIILLFKNALLNIVTMQGDSGMHNQLAIPAENIDVVNDSSFSLDINSTDVFDHECKTIIGYPNIVSLIQIDTEDLRVSQPIHTTNDWKELMFIKNPKKDLILSLEQGIRKFKPKIVSELRNTMNIINTNITNWGLTNNGVLCANRFIDLIDQFSG